MKIVINKCYGGFGLSALATFEMAKRKGKERYFFDQFKDDAPLTLEEAQTRAFFNAYSVPNPKDYRLKERDADGLYKSANARAKKISIDDCQDDAKRNDPDLIAVVEMLEAKANGFAANLSIVEIPDGIEWEIEEYDGQEWVSEKHRTWN